MSMKMCFVLSLTLKILHMEGTFFIHANYKVFIAIFSVIW